MNTSQKVALPRALALIPAGLFLIAGFLKWHEHQMQDMLWVCFSCLAIMTLALSFRLSRLLKAAIVLEFTAFELWILGMFNGEFSTAVSILVHLGGLFLALYLSYRTPGWQVSWHLAVLTDSVIFALSYFFTDPLQNINLAHGLPHGSPLYQNSQGLEILGIVLLVVFLLWANERILIFCKSYGSRDRGVNAPF